MMMRSRSESVVIFFVKEGIRTIVLSLIVPVKNADRYLMESGSNAVGDL